jgi:hypothetical protein
MFSGMSFMKQTKSTGPKHRALRNPAQEVSPSIWKKLLPPPLAAFFPSKMINPLQRLTSVTCHYIAFQLCH